VKDHEFRESVNELKKLVDVYASTCQLRAHLAVFLLGFKNKVEDLK